jgi:hypothetical protein
LIFFARVCHFFATMFTFSPQLSFFRQIPFLFCQTLLSFSPQFSHLFNVHIAARLTEASEHVLKKPSFSCPHPPPTRPATPPLTWPAAPLPDGPDPVHPASSPTCPNPPSTRPTTQPPTRPAAYPPARPTRSAPSTPLPRPAPYAAPGAAPGARSCGGGGGGRREEGLHLGNLILELQLLVCSALCSV